MEGLTPRGGKLLSRLQLAEGLVTFPRTVPSFNPDGQKVFQVWWLRILALELRTSVSYVCDVAGADALTTFFIPVFQPLHAKMVVYEIPAHIFYLCVDSDESSFGCL